MPKQNASEAALVDGISVYGVTSLREAIEHLEGRKPIPRERLTVMARGSSPDSDAPFDLIAGNEAAKRAIVIAAAGVHNVALYGPPGTGKTLLARSLGSLLPQLSPEEALEVTEIPTSLSLSVIVGLLVITIVASLVSPKGKAQTAISNARRYATRYLDLDYETDADLRERTYAKLTGEVSKMRQMDEKYKKIIRNEDELMQMIDEAKRVHDEQDTTNRSTPV